MRAALRIYACDKAGSGSYRYNISDMYVNPMNCMYVCRVRTARRQEVCRRSHSKLLSAHTRRLPRFVPRFMQTPFRKRHRETIRKPLRRCRNPRHDYLIRPHRIRVLVHGSSIRASVPSTEYRPGPTKWSAGYPRCLRRPQRPRKRSRKSWVEELRDCYVITFPLAAGVSKRRNGG
jgi:hypothetical protein